MNIKIKATGVACIVPDDYDKVYTALVKVFGSGATNLFSKRVPGHEYLQWELPGEGWQSLANADPFMGAQVRRELDARKQDVVQKFGTNTKMAYSVLSVPADEYVYYKPDANGNIDIKLTAWGYRYPERVDGGNIVGKAATQTARQHLTIRLEDDGNGLADKELRLNGFRRSTDKAGNLVIGEVPVGTEFDLEIDGERSHYKVKKDEAIVLIDCTKYVGINVHVTENGTPAEGIAVNVAYGSRSLLLTTDSQGNVSTRLPYGGNQSICNVKVEEIVQGRALQYGDNLFEFALVKAAPVPPPIPVKEELHDKSSTLEELGLTREVPPMPPVKDDVKEEPQGASQEEEIEVPPPPPAPPVVNDSVPPPPPEVGENGSRLGDTLVKDYSGASIWGIIGMVLLLAGLVTLTYLFGGGMLFG